MRLYTVGIVQYKLAYIISYVSVKNTLTILRSQSMHDI